MMIYKIYNIIKMIVEHIKNSLRNQDKLIRYGGDEFIIYLPNIEIEDFYLIMQIFCENYHNNLQLHMKCSIFSARLQCIKQGQLKKQFFHSIIIIPCQKKKFACCRGRSSASVRNDTMKQFLLLMILS